MECPRCGGRNPQPDTVDTYHCPNCGKPSHYMDWEEDRP